MDHAGTENDRSHILSQFWQQWQESRGLLYRCCLKMMNSNPMDAEDALSQAMVKAWEKVQKFGEKITNLKAWLYQVTRNFCIDLIRKGSRAAVGVESIEWVGNTEEVITTGTVECPESVLEREERSERIRGAIAELPEKYRETFILHFYRELSHKEIAEQQGISYDNVCKRISLARKRLKEKLSAYFLESESEVSAKGHSSLQMSVESQFPTPEENGEKQQQIRSQDDKSVLETQTVSVESEIAKVQPFPKNNAMFGCHSITPSGDRPISPSQPKAEKHETVDCFGELDRVRIISYEKTDLRYTEEISLFSPFPAPLFISIQRSMRLKAIVGLNITDVVNVSRDPPFLSRLSVFWQNFMQGVGWKGGGGAIIRRKKSISFFLTSSTANIRRDLMDNAETQSDRSHLISQFWQQWQESRDQLYRCCLKMMNFNPMDAEDALSQAMVKAWEKVQKFGEKITNLKAWLYQVTRNFCIDLIRKRSKEAAGTDSLEWVGATENAIAPRGVDAPEQILEREEQVIVIRAAIEALPELLHETFSLHFYRQLSHQDIASEQGISYENVCKRICLARKHLKQQLSDYIRGNDNDVRGISAQSVCRTKKEIGHTAKNEAKAEHANQLLAIPPESINLPSAVAIEAEIPASAERFVEPSVVAEQAIMEKVIVAAEGDGVERVEADDPDAEACAVVSGVSVWTNVVSTRWIMPHRPSANDVPSSGMAQLKERVRNMNQVTLPILDLVVSWLRRSAHNSAIYICSISSHFTPFCSCRACYEPKIGPPKSRLRPRSQPRAIPTSRGNDSQIKHQALEPPDTQHVLLV
ncbi:RNA polymerase sigma factor [Okeania sp. KiyG1]|uniref:RNA polymerase sigma factor n=1 Tax=Okeania sp. KiyG1 TaxID=2720165 RepID=UPI0019235277|nr:sigma-70 family RNA polymerase sigma factor [Okeania sp. KiyG1]GGA06308.1 hypothetical protein CYANOKiyG1_18740 [Okeania sp. KiyG1]